MNAPAPNQEKEEEISWDVKMFPGIKHQQLLITFTHPIIGMNIISIYVFWCIV